MVQALNEITDLSLTMEDEPEEPALVPGQDPDASQG
jgi:hypothetical protein